MTDKRLDETISNWLEAQAPSELNDRVLRTTFERTRKSRQHGGWRALPGRIHVNRFVFQLGGAAVVVLFAALAVGVYFNQAGIGLRPGSEASASPSQSAAPETTPPTPTPTTEPTSAPTATSEPTAEPTSTPPPALYTWNSQSADEDWPAPLRVEQPGAGLVTPDGHTFSDAVGDTTPGLVSAVDISSMNIFMGCQAGAAKLRCLEIYLAGHIPDPLPQPQDAWYGFGIVLDVDSDGVPDYRYGVDNFNTGAGPCEGPIDNCKTMPGRIWRADLHTGQVEVVAVPQGSDDTLLAELPGSDGFPGIFHFKGVGGRFYAWSSLIQDGQVVATDYAPNTGWLELVNK